MNFPEDFLHYVWQFRLFEHHSLRTTAGESLEIIHQGFLNKHAGPDFNNAKIKIARTLWAGNVEIHLKSSDWMKHNHQNDRLYDNVVLHVVYIHDQEIVRTDGTAIPVLELKSRIAEELILKYEQLFLNLNDFPCSGSIGTVDELVINSFLARTLVERFEDKSTAVFETLNQLKGNWDETFYRFLARNFGFKVNALPFELLAKTVPQQLYGKHKNNIRQVEALLFGGAGFLKDKFEDEYPAGLKREFDFLAKKYQIKPLDVSIWKFMRMRPQNFPTLRLAQFAALITKSSHLFSRILETSDTKSLRHLFEDLPVNEYWQNHFHFKKETINVSLQPGKTSIDNILLNTVALFLFAYGKHTNNQFYVNRAIELLELLPPEQNAIIAKYADAGIGIKNAFATQGIIQLKKNYCDHKKCLSCGIGIKILKQV